jgi:hypothetical protein
MPGESVPRQTTCPKLLLARMKKKEYEEFGDEKISFWMSLFPSPQPESLPIPLSFSVS